MGSGGIRPLIKSQQSAAGACRRLGVAATGELGEILYNQFIMGIRTYPSPDTIDPYGVLEDLMEQSLTFASKSDSAAKRH